MLLESLIKPISFLFIKYDDADFLPRETNLLFGQTHLLSCCRLGHDRNNNTHDIWALAQITRLYTCGELSNTHTLGYFF